MNAKPLSFRHPRHRRGHPGPGRPPAPQGHRNTLTSRRRRLRVWEAVRDFGNLAWHPAVGSTTLDKGVKDKRGAVRTVTTKDGAKLVEELLSHQDSTRSLKYRIIDSPLPVSDYVHLASGRPKGGSRVEWSSTFKRKDEKARRRGRQRRRQEGHQRHLHQRPRRPQAAARSQSKPSALWMRAAFCVASHASPRCSSSPAWACPPWPAI